MINWQFLCSRGWLLQDQSHVLYTSNIYIVHIYRYVKNLMMEERAEVFYITLDTWFDTDCLNDVHSYVCNLALLYTCVTEFEKPLPCWHAIINYSYIHRNQDIVATYCIATWCLLHEYPLILSTCCLILHEMVTVPLLMYLKNRWLVLSSK